VHASCLLTSLCAAGRVQDAVGCQRGDGVCRSNERFLRGTCSRQQSRVTTAAADQFGNNRTSANLDANILLLGRVVTSPAGPYPETAGSSLSVSAFQSVVLAHSTGSGFYLGRYVVQRTALRSSHVTYLRASIGRQARKRRFKRFLINADQGMSAACWPRTMEAWRAFQTRPTV
jgi:hypothetical protein